MDFWRSTARIVLTAGLLAVVVLGLTVFRVHRTTTPPVSVGPLIDFQSLGLDAQEVAFSAVDGLDLHGWLLRGESGFPAIVLCHDWGASTDTLVNLAIALRQEGFWLLLFDFRGHGKSGGRGSTLGLTEKRDILGALDFVQTLEGVERGRVGLYGVGMGAHAAVLAARERASARVLVLDGLYPDASFALVRRFYHGWAPVLPQPAFLPVGVFGLMTGTRPGGERADAALQTLIGRDLLFVAPARDAALALEIERMYRAVPEHPDLEGNLVTLPASHGAGLYGDDRARHQRRVTEFFSTRLRPAKGHGSR